jgi:putative transposase
MGAVTAAPSGLEAVLLEVQEGVLSEILRPCAKRHRFPLIRVAHAVWLYLRFSRSLRAVEEILLERGRR